MNISHQQHFPFHLFMQIPKRVILCLVCFFILSGSFILDAEQTWQGNAAMIRRGEFPEEGFYAASNSFPLNTKIRIKNLNNNRSTEVIIIERIREYYNVFLLLSEDAAIELGMSDNDVINVEVIVLKFGTGDTIGLPDDLTYNPDPDVFPLPTVLEVTPLVSSGPTPIPEIAPTPAPVPDETYEPVPESTFEQTTLPTEEPLIPAPTAEPTSEPETTAGPEPTPESTEEPTPEITTEPTQEITAEPTPETTPEITEEPAPDSDKLLFLPPHEDEMYVLTDVVKPLILDQEDVTDVEIDDAKIAESKAIDGSINTPDYSDDEDDYSLLSMDDPDIENPVIEDKTDPEKEDIDVIPDEIADIPELLQQEEPLPDPSNIMPDPGVYELGAIPVEPEVAEKESGIEEIAEAVSGKKDNVIALEPGEPFVPEEKSKESGELSNEKQVPLESGIVFDPKEPDVQDKQGEAPELISKIPGFIDKDIALVPGEPEPPPETGKETPDPSNIVPDTKDEVELAKTPEEPDPPVGKEKDTPDPSNIVPDTKDEVELAKTPEEPDPPVEKEKDTPDPSNIVPDTKDEVEIAKTPEDPDPPVEKDKMQPDPTPDVVITPTPEPTEIIPDDDVDVIITFESTEPQPPTDKDKDTSVVKETNKDLIPDELLAKGTYFIQLAAYADKEIALALENKYKKLYPVKMYEIKDKKIGIYKVLIGPLNKYESDTLLYRFKSLGYKDAFIKYNN